MGVVYKAHDTHLDRPVAVKVLPPEAVANPERKRRFIQEAKAASALNHPNIITIYDIDVSGGVDFIAMAGTGDEEARRVGVCSAAFPQRAAFAGVRARRTAGHLDGAGPDRVHHGGAHGNIWMAEFER